MSVNRWRPSQQFGLTLNKVGGRCILLRKGKNILCRVFFISFSLLTNSKIFLLFSILSNQQIFHKKMFSNNQRFRIA